MLLAAGGCTSLNVVSIPKNSRQAITDCYAELEAERDETDPKVFTKIHMRFVVTGKDIKPEIVDKASKLSADEALTVKKYVFAGRFIANQL